MQIPRWLFLAVLIYAPWAYGCTRPGTIIGLNWLLAAVLALRVGGAVLRHSRALESVPWPGPKLLLMAGGCLLAQGWWMAVNANAIFDPDYFVFVPIRAAISALPGSTDQALSVAWMVRATLLLGTIVFVADLSQRREWLLRLWWTVGLAGGSIALLGLLEKASGAPMVFWQASPEKVETFFATYRYHANAGAFLNLVLLPSIALAYRAFRRPASPAERALWLVVTVLVVMAVMANTSRVAQLLAVILLTVFVAISGSRIVELARQDGWARLALGSAIVVVALLALAQASHLERPWQRWQSLATSIPHDQRWRAAHLALSGVGESGLLGRGPGTFRVVFPIYDSAVGENVDGFWRFLHEDYLQTILEWGWLGAAMWAVVFFGGVAVGGRAWLCRFKNGFSSRQRLFLPAVVLGLIATALHALVDFPLQIASIQLYVATGLGICWGSREWRAGTAPV